MMVALTSNARTARIERLKAAPVQSAASPKRSVFRGASAPEIKICHVCGASHTVEYENNFRISTECPHCSAQYPDDDGIISKYFGFVHLSWICTVVLKIFNPMMSMINIKRPYDFIRDQVGCLLSIIARGIFKCSTNCLNVLSQVSNLTAPLWQKARIVSRMGVSTAYIISLIFAIALLYFNPPSYDNANTCHKMFLLQDFVRAILIFLCLYRWCFDNELPMASSVPHSPRLALPPRDLTCLSNYEWAKISILNCKLFRYSSQVVEESLWPETNLGCVMLGLNFLSRCVLGLFPVLCGFFYKADTWSPKQQNYFDFFHFNLLDQVLLTVVPWYAVAYYFSSQPRVRPPSNYSVSNGSFFMGVISVICEYWVQPLQSQGYESILRTWSGVAVFFHHQVYRPSKIFLI